MRDTGADTLSRPLNTASIANLATRAPRQQLGAKPLVEKTNLVDAKRPYVRERSVVAANLLQHSLEPPYPASLNFPRVALPALYDQARYESKKRRATA